MARSEIPFTVADASGNGVICQVTINVRGGGAATIFADEVGAATQTNPTFSDISGRVKGWLEEGSYTLVFGAPLSYSRAVEIVRGDGVGNIAPSVLGTAALPDGAVTQPKIADGVLATAKLGDLQLTEPKFADGAINARVYAPAGIAAANINDNSISTRTILDGSLTNAEVAAGVVASAALVDGGVTTAKLADGAVLTAKLADKSVSSDKLADAAITGAKVIAGVVPARAFDEAMPIGIIIPYLGASLPAGDNWWWCDGTGLGTAAYPDLYARIGATYGSASGLFYLPDLRGRFPFGYSPGGRAEVRTMGQSDNIGWGSRYPQHAHGQGSINVTGGGHEHTTEYLTGDVKGSFTIAGSCFYGVHRYMGNFWTGIDGSYHGHSVGGRVGDTSGVNFDTSSYFVSNFIIRIK